MVRRFIALTGVTLLSMLVIEPAAAGRPTIIRSDLTFSDHVDCADFGEFDFAFDISLEGRQTFKDFGDRVRIHTNIRGQALASDGTTLRIHHAWSEEIDLVKNTLTITGLTFGTWVEKTSIRRMDRGRLVLDLGSGQVVFAAGKWLPFVGPELATCELIAAAQA